MIQRRQVQLIREGDYLAEVEVTALEDTDPAAGWGPYFSLEDSKRLERVREAMRANDLATASREAKLFRLTPAA
jgi:hypothetical protein